jgi:hypothetical protein
VKEALLRNRKVILDLILDWEMFDMSLEGEFTV